MKAAIAAHARELGFDLCRFTTARPPASAAHFDAWLSEGWHGTMEYLRRNADRRRDPRLVLPGARSVIVVAVSYHLPDADSPVPPDKAHGVIARYARHSDYHDRLADPLRALAAFVDAQGPAGTRSLWYVDTGPILERDLAQRAGVGFVGKHTNLISRELGNWFLIAEILTTLELEPDEPERNRCGTCTRCLTACPTEAIRAPFQLDARRCIAYLTIEHKGSIPEEFRPQIGNRIFGCDDCLAVCPWNRFAREGRLMRQPWAGDLHRVPLVEWMSLTEEGFRSRFRSTPLWRGKRRGLLRNVCVALGNSGDRSALPVLEHAAADPEPLIAEHARWAITRLSSGAAPSDSPRA